MKSLRVGLDSLVLVIADLAGIAGGALVAFRILRVTNQVWLQLPIAVALSGALSIARECTGAFWFLDAVGAES